MKAFRAIRASLTPKTFKKNEHLPGFPSAIQAGANGVELGNLNKVLLKHQEELTLHLIEQNKKIEILMQLMQKQQDDINKLKSENSKSL